MNASRPRRLEQHEWVDYFNVATKALREEIVEVEVISEDLGAQHEIRGKRLMGMGYDPNNDLFQIVCVEIEHMIGSPSEIYVDEEGDLFRSLMVVEKDMTRHIVKLLRSSE